jgi:hypothetical protein
VIAEQPVQASHPKENLGLLRFVPDLYVVALLAMLGAILIVSLAPRLDTDFWWHLKDGQYILNHHVVPSKDFMSFTLRGHAWTDHEWLAEIVLYSTYKLAGLWGPIVFFAAVICATFTLVYTQMRQRGVHPVPAIFMLAVAFMASSASWGPRIQMSTLFFLAAYGVLLLRFEQTRDRRILAVLPLLMIVWTNFHGGFVLGLVFVALTLGGQWLNRVTRHEDAWSSSDLKALLIALVVTLLVTMLNPNGFRQLVYPLTFILPNPYTNLIEESASPNFHMVVMMIFEAMLLLTVVSLYLAKARVNWVHLALIIAFTHLALSQSRNVAVWAVVVSPLLAWYLQQTVPTLKIEFPMFSYRRRPVEGRTGQILNLVLLLLVVVVYFAEGTHFVNPTTLRTAEVDNYPKPAIAYMRTHNLPPRVFASYSWGGYLLWNLFPKYRDYMDSRADTLYTRKILQGYLDIYTAAPDWKQTLNQYRIQTVLIERGAPLVQVLALTKGWHLRYQDSMASLYSR